MRPNPPYSRFKYIAKQYGDKHPDVVLDTFWVLADTVGIEHPRNELEFAKVWYPLVHPVTWRRRFRKQLAIAGFASVYDNLRDTWTRTDPDELLSQALAEVESHPAMARGKESDPLWPWVARELLKCKKASLRTQEPLHYLECLDELSGKGSALSLWQRQEKIDLGKWSLGDALAALRAFEVAHKITQRPPVFTWPDGWTVQKLLAEDLEIEGEVMQNCVGQYVDAVGGDYSVIYSLRDPNGNPHVDMEYRPAIGRFIQVYGKQNAEPIPEYQKRVDEFADKKGIKPAELTEAELTELTNSGHVYGTGAWESYTMDWIDSLVSIEQMTFDITGEDVKQSGVFLDADLEDLEEAGLLDEAIEAITDGANVAWDARWDEALANVESEINHVNEEFGGDPDMDADDMARMVMSSAYVVGENDIGWITERMEPMEQPEP